MVWVAVQGAAYGANERENIPANSMLIFDVEMIAIEKLPAPPTGL